MESRNEVKSDKNLDVIRSFSFYTWLIRLCLVILWSMLNFNNYTFYGKFDDNLW